MNEIEVRKTKYFSKLKKLLVGVVDDESVIASSVYDFAVDSKCDKDGYSSVHVNVGKDAGYYLVKEKLYKKQFYSRIYIFFVCNSFDLEYKCCINFYPQVAKMRVDPPTNIDFDIDQESFSLDCIRL